MIDHRQATATEGFPKGVDMRMVCLVMAGFLALYFPTWQQLATSIWSRDEQGHGPIIMVVSGWLLWRLWPEIHSRPKPQHVGLGTGVFILGLALNWLGRSQYILMLETASMILIISGLILFYRGPTGLRLAWFPLFFLIFTIPLPSALVAAATTPLKSAVSAVAADLIHALGYPIARAGVILSIGPYQLLVADACAGLNSMFTLEALGLLYMNIARHGAVWRNVLLAILVVPISFFANVTRVCVLVFVTYYFGDAAGQGFMHGFAGMVLFLVALCLILAVDGTLGLIAKRKGNQQ
ncbi:MAG: exosortase B [Burkholderiales bacterium]|nr:exosortase B [Burkholderiales bacterium]